MHPLKSTRQIRCLEAIQNDQYSVISFDIFDTLVLRRLWQPTDLFEVMARDPAARKVLGDRDFAELRYAAERELRLKAKEISPLVDPTLGQIYDNFRRITGLREAEAKLLAELELSYELRFIAPRSAAMPLFEHAKMLGKTVILNSDMYLPRKTIMAMLEKCGYQNYDRLYISCEIGATKKDGALFRHIAADIGEAPEAFLHFGDNAHSDLAMAKQSGWKQMHLVAPRDQMVKASQEGLIGLIPPLAKPSELNEPASRASFGLLKGRVFSDHLDAVLTPTLDDQTDLLQRFGYTALGPFLLSIALWVRRLAQKQGITHVAWLARDGALPLQATQLLDEALGEAFKSSYLPISRKLIFPYLLNTPGGIEQILKIGYKQGFPVHDFVKERFGQAGLDILRDATKDGAPFVLSGVMGDYHDLVCETLRANADALAAASSDQDRNLRTYFQSVFTPGESAALFDVGRKGTFQAVLNRICNQELHGFYVTNSYEIHRNAPNHAFSSFLGVIDPKKQARPPDTMLYEAFLSEKAPGFIGFSENGTPLRGDRDSSDMVKGFFEALHSSALDYVRDAIALYGSQVVILEQDPYFAAYGLEHWLENEHVRTLMQSAPHEDPVSVAQDKSLLDYFQNAETNKHIDFFLPQRRAERRIALYCPAMTRVRGGAERIGARVANALHLAGYEVLIFCSGRPGGNITPVFPLEPGILVRNVDTRSVEQITQLIADFTPDAGLILASGPAVVPISLGFLNNEIPYLLSERACPVQCLKTYWQGFDAEDYNVAHDAADMAAVQFPSFLRHFPAHMQNRIVVLANPIEVPDNIVPANQKKKLILCAARIWFEQKRQDILLGAFAKIARAHPNWHLAFYGNAYHDNREKLQNAVTQHGLSSQVAIHDATPDLQARLDEASIFVLPSAFEGFPNALAEALASGLPAIGFASCAGVNELIKDGVNGLLVSDTDLEALGETVSSSAGNEILATRLASALDQMIRDEEFRAQASQAAHKHMCAYRAEEVLPSWLDITRQLVEMPGDQFALPRRMALQILNNRRLDGQIAPKALPKDPVKTAAADQDLTPYLAETIPVLQKQLLRARAPIKAIMKSLLGLAPAPLPSDLATFLEDTLSQHPNIHVPVPASFNEQGYLEANPDIAEAVKTGRLQSGYLHYLRYGYSEGRPRTA